MRDLNSHRGSWIRFRIPMNLQFFAEAEGAGGGAGAADTGDAAGTEGQGQQDKVPSFDDFLKDPKHQAEFDRRVNKALETSRTKWQAEMDTKMAEAKTEAEKLAAMNAEQKAQYEQEKKNSELNAREQQITKRELMATAKEQLADKGLPTSLADVLDYTSAEACTKSMDKVAKAFQEAVEKSVNARLSGGQPPKKADNNKTYTMEQIKAMTPAEINANWEAVQAALKSQK
ncbi:MAG: DUF4355 domain-containing protein [Clostridia bacterium]|nr:DUF4355 domain-containing protein [Clostridia bacterium]